MKKFILFALCLTFLASASLFMVGCKNDNKHTHSFTVEKVADKYLSSVATCTQKAKYFYSCKCGEKGTETFEYGDAIAHPMESKWSYNETHHWHNSTCACNVKADYAEHTTDSSGWCSVCQQVVLPTDGVLYDVSADGTYAEVVAYVGEYSKVKISDTYNNLPVRNIYDEAFENATITSIIIPDSVTSIGRNAFYWCRGLTSVNYLGTIDQWAEISFYNYSSNPLYYARQLYINNELVTEVNLTTATKISAYAFENCSGLTNITIPDSIISIGDSAFYNCNGLTSVNYLGTIDQWAEINFGSETSNPLYYAKKLYINNELVTEVNLTTATKISAYAFENCSGLTNITIPDSITSIGDSVFRGCSELTSVNYLGTIDQWVEINFGNESSNPLYYAKKLYINNELVTEVNLTTATKIYDYAFFNYSGLTNITIPNSVTSIGDFAFYNCSGLTNITIPDSVTSIGAYAFYNCSGLTNITIPNSVTSIGDFAFCGCSGLTNITIPDNVTSIGGAAFDDCSGLTNITIPNGVTSIGGDAFFGCRGLISVTIPDSVTSIGNDAFHNCSGLTSVNYLGTIDQWVEINFSSSSSNPLYYAKKLYINNELITEVNLTTATKISASAFENCKGLTSITIPDSVTSIGYFAFRGCSGLTSITIPDSVTSIDVYAFYNCGGITSVTIGNGVTSIGASAFSGCSGLKTVYYKGTAEQWGKISINGGNDYLTNATRYYYSETEPTLNADGTAYDGNYWHYADDGITPVIWKKEN